LTTPVDADADADDAMPSVDTCEDNRGAYSLCRHTVKPFLDPENMQSVQSFFGLSIQNPRAAPNVSIRNASLAHFIMFVVDS
jgi:hypothetical protein